MSWVKTTGTLDAPFQNKPKERARTTLIRAVSQFEVASAERYRKRDVTGDGRDETWCNRFVSDVTRALGCEIPFLLANQQLEWLRNNGQVTGWWRVGRQLARHLALEGFPVVACYQNKSGHGHIAILVPPLSEGVWIAQAGNTNFDCGPLEQGFGNLLPEFWAHV